MISMTSANCTNPTGECQICFDVSDLPIVCHREGCHPITCEKCWMSHIRTTVEAGLYAAPQVKCPGCNLATPSSAWFELADGNTRNKYLANARALLSIRCCGISSYFEDMVGTVSSRVSCTHDLPADSRSRLQEALVQYVHCDRSAQECVSQLVQFLPETMHSAHELMPLVCSTPALCQDPERRATLQLAILNRMPKTYTPCCSNQICFRCKTYGWHEGTCEEIQRREMGQRVCFCPHCGVPTMKSEGCDHMICVCGQDWTWGSNPLLQLLRDGTKTTIEPLLRELHDINAILEGSHLSPIDYFLQHMVPDEDTLSILKLFASLGAIASPTVHEERLWNASFELDLSLAKILLRAFHKISPLVTTELLDGLVERLCASDSHRRNRAALMNLSPSEYCTKMLEMAMLFIEFGADLYEVSLNFSSLSNARRAECPPELLCKLRFVKVAADTGSDILDERLIRHAERSVARAHMQKRESHLKAKQASFSKQKSMRPRGGRKKVSESYEFEVNCEYS